MTTQYSREISKGRFEHYESKAKYESANAARTEDWAIGLFFVAGLVIGGLGCYVALKTYTPALPKLASFALILGSAAAAAFTLGRLAPILLRFLKYALLAAVLYTALSALWKLL